MGHELGGACSSRRRGARPRPSGSGRAPARRAGTRRATSTAGCDSSTRSISSGKMLMPFMIIMSSARPWMTSRPSRSIDARSPGTNQPSTKWRAVAVGSPRYAVAMPGARNRIDRRLRRAPPAAVGAQHLERHGRPRRPDVLVRVVHRRVGDRHERRLGAFRTRRRGGARRGRGSRAAAGYGTRAPPMRTFVARRAACRRGAPRRRGRCRASGDSSSQVGAEAARTARSATSRSSRRRGGRCRPATACRGACACCCCTRRARGAARARRRSRCGCPRARRARVARRRRASARLSCPSP